MSEQTTPRPVGRPSEYDPAYCERVIDLGKQGMSRAEIASALDCSRTTMTAWEKAHTEFLSAVQRAKDESLAWWERQPRKNLSNKNFNAALWSKSVSGRFPDEPYRDRVQVTGKNDGPIEYANLTEEQIDARLADLAAGSATAEPAGEA